MSDLKVKLAPETPQDETKSTEETVLENAVESGDIAPEVAGVVTDGDVPKINLDNIPDHAIQERETETMDVGEQARDGEGVDQQVREQPSQEDAGTEEPSGVEESPIEIIEDEPTQQEVPEQQVSEQQPIQADHNESEDGSSGELQQPELPEGIDKLVDFMKETGGTLDDYVKLNRDLENMDGVAILKEQIRNQNPDFTEEEIGFLLEDEYGYDPEVADERTVKKKQIAFKKAVSDAKRDLGSMRDKYYEDLKYSRSPKLTDEAKEAILAYEKSQEQAKVQKAIADDLASKTNKFFDGFKGFEFKLGDKKVRYKADPAKVKQQNSDFNSFMSSFSDDKGYVTKPDVYHKTLYAAQNIDRIAQHFYDQGRADAIKSEAKAAKNINMGARQDAGSIKTPDGTKVRVVSGDDSGKLRFKLRQYR